MSSPLLIDGRKTGLRVYVIVDDLKRSYSLSQVGLVKLAPKPYQLADPLAEIIGPYERHNGSWPTIYLLNALVASADTSATWRPIRAGIEETIGRLMKRSAGVPGCSIIATRRPRSGAST